MLPMEVLSSFVHMRGGRDREGLDESGLQSPASSYAPARVNVINEYATAAAIRPKPFQNALPFATPG